MAYTPRTPKQETRFGQALGYAWGRNDERQAQNQMPETNSVDFADWYSRNPGEITGSLQMAWKLYPTVLTA